MRDRPGQVGGTESSIPGHNTSIVRWLTLAILVVFAESLVVGVIMLAVWWLSASIHGRGRDIRPLVAPAVGGWTGLAMWTFLSGHSPLNDALAAQVMLARAFIVGSDVPVEHLLARWLAGGASLALGFGPSLSLLAGWKISRRAADGRISPRVADQARAGAEHPVDGVLLGFMPDGRPVILDTRELAAHMLVAGAPTPARAHLSSATSRASAAWAASCLFSTVRPTQRCPSSCAI